MPFRKQTGYSQPKNAVQMACGKGFSWLFFCFLSRETRRVVLLFFALAAQFFYRPKKLSPRDKIRHIASAAGRSAVAGGTVESFFIC